MDSPVRLSLRARPAGLSRVPESPCNERAAGKDLDPGAGDAESVLPGMVVLAAHLQQLHLAHPSSCGSYVLFEAKQAVGDRQDGWGPLSDAYSPTRTWWPASR